MNFNGIREYIEVLERASLSMHSMIIEKGGDIVFEHYWEPFDENFLHRMYSVSKSITALAVGFLEQDGFISLDDRILKYFPKESTCVTDEGMQKQTIRHMLTMTTSRTNLYWFDAKPQDRVHYYFSATDVKYQKPLNIFDYDSDASFVLGALVEKLTGKRLLDYLREKLFDKIGVSKEVKCLECPGGHSWADSAILCTTRDLLKVARFVMNKGKVGDEQVLNESFITDAVSKQVDNNVIGTYDYDTQGYGYQIWRTYQDSFAFLGMGNQYAICVPEQDLIFVCNADNQGLSCAAKLIFDGFFHFVVNSDDESTEESTQSYKELMDYCNTLKLAVAKGNAYSELVKEIDGVKYVLNPNPMGISKVWLTFSQDGGVLNYVNAQGQKQLHFKMCENEFSLFPEEGYSNEVGNQSEKGHKYKCAASAAWLEKNKLFIKVQIIDEYFGRLNIVIGFEGETIGICMEKGAEDFLKEYEGFASGTRG